MTKKEIVRQIADQIQETQLKTKDIVQRTFNAIVDTLIKDRRIELRNFGVFEVKLRKARKARNPRTNVDVQVPPKFVVTFKPGKYMEDRVRALIPTVEELTKMAARKSSTPAPTAGSAPVPLPVPAAAETNGSSDGAEPAKPKKKRTKKASQA